jgi:glycosyltransferase involved in cell wall biosynthesis
MSFSLATIHFMGKPLTFSVGIPTFNQADFLEETILSLLNQTRPPDEIVISDHYSTDNTADIIQKYAKHVRGVQPPPGVRLAGQYSFTLMSQTSDWITIFCSDDIALPNYAEVLMRGAARAPDAALVRASWQLIDSAGAVTSKENLLSVPRLQKAPDTLLTQRHGPKVCGTSFAVRREAFHRSGPILDSIQSLVDWALFVQVAPFGTFIREPEIIAGYRVGHDGNKFRNRIGMWIRDEQRMFYEVMPLAAERASMADRTWIDEASRANFFRYLRAASEEFAPEERLEITPLFEPWAARVDGAASLRDFAAGKRLSAPVSLLDRGKKILRPTAQRLYSLLHRS